MYQIESFGTPSDSLISISTAVVLLLTIASDLTWAQWDPLADEPQWEKPRHKRTPGADQPWPPWDQPVCPTDQAGPCMLPPYYPYEEIRREIPNVGIVIGRSMAYQMSGYINLFLGVPYAKPPVYERRFMVSRCVLHCIQGTDNV